MRKLITPLLMLALVACAAPAASPPTARPSAEMPGDATVAPPTAEAPATPTVAPAPTEAPTATPQPGAAPAGEGEPSEVIGYGQASAAAFVPGEQALAVATEAGLLILELPGLDARSFVPIPGGAGDIAVSPDGRTVALAQGRGPGDTVVLLGPPGGPPERELAGSQPVFSPDGSLLALFQYDIGTGNTSTALHRMPDGELIATVDGQDPRFSPDGGLVATTSQAEALVSRADGGELVRRQGFGIAFSPDGAMVAFATETGAVVHPLRDGGVDVETTLLLAPGWARFVDFGPDNRLYAAVDEQLQVWDVAGQAEVAERQQVYGEVAIDARGELLAIEAAIGDAPDRLEMFRLSDRQKLYDDEGPLGGRHAFGFSAETPQAAVVTLSGELVLVDVAQGVVASRTLVGYDRAALDAAGRELALGRGLLAELYPLGGAGPRLSLGEHRLLDGLRELSFEGQRLVAEINRFVFGAGTGRFDAVSWDVAAGSGGGALREQGPLTAGAFGFSEMAQPIAWDYDPASGRMAWRDADGTIYLDDGTPEGAEAVAGAPADVRAIALAPGGERLAMADAAGELFVVDGAGAPLMRGPAGEGVAIVGLAWSGDGAWLALRLENGDLLLQEALDDDPPLRIAGAPSDIALAGGGPLALSADGSRLAAGGYEGAAVYGRDGAELLRVAGETHGLALGADGRTLVALRDGRALVYRLSQ